MAGEPENVEGVDVGDGGGEAEELPVHGWRGYHSFTFGRAVFTVDRRYTDLRPVGRGAYGLVCAATDLLTGRDVAIKQVDNLFADLVDAKRILREVKLLRHLGEHDNIIELVDVMTSPPDSPKFDTLYIVTQLYECDLERIVLSAQRLTEAHLKYFVYQLLRGLKYIHSANVLHRDLKPPNLLVNAKCDLAIADFGLARGVSSETVEAGTLTEYVVTRWYRAPELLCESKEYGAAIDVWSVGCIMGELLARRPILQGSSTNQQLQLIIQLLGTPSEEELTSIESESARSVIESMGYRPKTDLSTVFIGADPVAIDLLARFLEFDHRRRITVQDALEHPFLDSLHGKIEDPVCDTEFDFEFERGFPEAMPRDLLQDHLFSTMCELHHVIPNWGREPGAEGGDGAGDGMGGAGEGGVDGVGMGDAGMEANSGMGGADMGDAGMLGAGDDGMGEPGGMMGHDVEVVHAHSHHHDDGGMDSHDAGMSSGFTPLASDGMHHGGEGGMVTSPGYRG